MKEIVMPKLSDTMTEGKLISWKKRVGDTIKRGDVIAEVETDKANMELEAYSSGVLLEILIEGGETAEVGTVIGRIGSPEEAAAGKAGAEKKEAPPAAPAPPEEEKGPAEPATAAAGEKGGEPAATPVQERPAEKEGAAAVPAEEAGDTEPGEEFISAVVGGAGKEPVAPGAPTPPEAKGEESSAGKAPAGGRPAQEGGAGERAAPVVRRRARELGIELSQVPGTGPEGRILLEDLEKYSGAAGVEGKEPERREEKEAPLEERKAPAAPRGEPQALSKQRSAIARTVSESWRSIPHFGVTMDVLMDEAEKLRQQLKEGGLAVSLNDLVVKGAALALEEFPQLNASFAGEKIVQGTDVNICIAVTVPDGLVMPVVSRCQELSLKEIGERCRALVERARSGRLTEQEMTGGTFSVSNLGMYGVSQFSAIIYPSHAGVLAVGGVADSVVAKGGIPVVAKTMKVTLSADHRVVDGAYAAQFLQKLKEILEHPLRLLI
ncbi:2-oxo acid dehydrogenase subunit E2 [Geomonas sp. RF6]|uniref:dihydrolipoamide acetyltransferase family protein n=1 Tax=Geomonas sp. RF6 TaxID=2897342 RepID=UPI001E63BD0F|nr:dihydrolipoamide acetyltransferase family protein [Geomonas sp. RF6]UFS69518.1 2-oxo acid dehydrogenase subunit E2 [Geomonas sp. RF6]